MNTEVGKRIGELHAKGQPVDVKALRAAVEKELHSVLFVELFGNALHTLPQAPGTWCGATATIW